MIRRLCLVGLAALTMVLVFAISGSAFANAADDYPTTVESHGGQVADSRGMNHHAPALSGESQMNGETCPSDCTGGGACCGVIHCLTALAGLPSGDALLLVAYADAARAPAPGSVPAGIRHAPDLRPPVFG